MPNRCRFCEITHVETKVVIIGQDWVEFCDPCGDINLIHNTETKINYTLNEVFTASKAGNLAKTIDGLSREHEAALEADSSNESYDRDEEDGPCTDPNYDRNDEVGVWPLGFSYKNRNGGKARNWTVNLFDAIYFEFRTSKYMVIRGERNGPVCFNIARMEMDKEMADSLAEFLHRSVNQVQQADPDCFPTEDTQDWMLCNAGIR